MAFNHKEEANEILDKEFRVLDKGFVRLVDYMGSDERVVASARVSYGKGTKTFREDRALIHYLMKNEHTSPFEQVVFTFHIKLPIFVARQWIRHRTARVNEVSGRYSVMKEEFYIPELSAIAPQSRSNKQGRDTTPFEESEANEIRQMIEETFKNCYRNYEKLLEKNLAKEIARIVLPLSLYTEWYWQIDLHNLFHFLKLRLHPHAQYEIRQYANTLLKIAKIVAPVSVEAFEEYSLKSVTFSKEEIEKIKENLSLNNLPQSIIEKLKK